MSTPSMRSGSRKRRRLEEQFFRLALEAAPTGMLMMDGTGKIVLVNAQIETLFGYPREELLGQRIEMLVPARFGAHHPDLRDTFFLDPTARPMGAGRELFGLRKDGTEVPIEIGLNPLQTPEGDFVLSTIADITERKRSDERFHLAIEAAPTGMLMIDEAGKIVLVNAQIETLFGYPREELLGQRIEMLVPERFRAHHPGLRDTFFRDPTTRLMGGERELYGLRKDGTEVPIEIGLNPLRTPDGEFVLSSVVDITERHEIEQMRRGFISTVSHELRTPLTSISGSLGLLRSGTMGALPDKAATMVRIAYQNSERLVRIINDILDIGKIDAGALDLRMVSAPLLDLVRQSVEANSGYAEKHQIRFVLDSAPAGGCVLADADRLMQVLGNLLSNAAKFSQPGADVLIRVRGDVTSMRVEVEDSGPGIPEKFRARIFEQFAQADHSSSRRFDGTGLGLNIAKKLLEAMGGTIGFSSVTGRGTIFYFELPRLEEAPMMPAGTRSSESGRYPAPLAAAGAAVGAAAEAPTDLPRVLHVEGDPDLVSVIREAFAGRADVVPAHTLRDAERLLGEGGFSLAVLDQSLPDGNGLGLVDRVPELAGRALPIIILSTTDVSRAIHAKVAAVLVKAQASAPRIVSTILSCLAQSRS
jgi:PAS domain S-box-containing protein